jgi:hypothetical protein
MSRSVPSSTMRPGTMSPEPSSTPFTSIAFHSFTRTPHARQPLPQHQRWDDYGSGLGKPGKSPYKSVGAFARFGNHKPLKRLNFGAQGRNRTTDTVIFSPMHRKAE